MFFFVIYSTVLSIEGSQFHKTFQLLQFDCDSVPLWKAWVLLLSSFLFASEEESSFRFSRPEAVILHLLSLLYCVPFNFASTVVPAILHLKCTNQITSSALYAIMIKSPPSTAMILKSFLKLSSFQDIAPLIFYLDHQIPRKYNFH